MLQSRPALANLLRCFSWRPGVQEMLMKTS